MNLITIQTGTSHDTHDIVETTTHCFSSIPSVPSKTQSVHIGVSDVSNDFNDCGNYGCGASA